MKKNYFTKIIAICVLSLSEYSFGAGKLCTTSGPITSDGRVFYPTVCIDVDPTPTAQGAFPTLSSFGVDNKNSGWPYGLPAVSASHRYHAGQIQNSSNIAQQSTPSLSSNTNYATNAHNMLEANVAKSNSDFLNLS